MANRIVRVPARIRFQHLLNKRQKRLYLSHHAQRTYAVSGRYAASITRVGPKDGSNVFPDTQVPRRDISGECNLAHCYQNLITVF
jgi:hypothetical protein